MREHKFRAWDKKRNEWYGESNPRILTFKGFHIFGECTLLCTPLVGDLQHLEITDFIGALDKNNNEMYENDIVKCPQGWLGIIKYYKTKMYYACEEIVTQEVGSHGPIFDEWNELEIIGNTYENHDAGDERMIEKPEKNKREDA